MADKVLALSSLFFDALNKVYYNCFWTLNSIFALNAPQVRVVEPDDYEASEQSVDEARLFTGRVDQFLNHAQVLFVNFSVFLIVSTFQALVTLARQLGAEVERHKLKALALRLVALCVETATPMFLVQKFHSERRARQGDVASSAAVDDCREASSARSRQ